MRDSSPPNPTVYRSLCLLSPIPPLPLLSITVFHHHFMQCESQPIFLLYNSLLFTFRPHCGRRGMCQHRDTHWNIWRWHWIACWLLHLIKKTFHSLLTLSSWSPPAVRTLIYQNGNSVGAGPCIFYCNLCANMLPSSANSAEVSNLCSCLLPGKLTASSNFLTPLLGKRNKSSYSCF